MKGFMCKLCNKNSVTPVVQIIYNNRTVHTNESAIKAENWALEEMVTPCIVRYKYVCGNCNYQEINLERLYSDKLRVGF